MTYAQVDEIYNQQGIEILQQELEKLEREELSKLYKILTYNRARIGKKETKENIIKNILDKVKNNPMNNWNIWETKRLKN